MLVIGHNAYSKQRDSLCGPRARLSGAGPWSLCPLRGSESLAPDGALGCGPGRRKWDRTHLACTNLELLCAACARYMEAKIPMWPCLVALGVTPTATCESEIPGPDPGPSSQILPTPHPLCHSHRKHLPKHSDYPSHSIPHPMPYLLCVKCGAMQRPETGSRTPHEKSRDLGDTSTGRVGLGLWVGCSGTWKACRATLGREKGVISCPRALRQKEEVLARYGVTACEILHLRPEKPD